MSQLRMSFFGPGQVLLSPNKPVKIRSRKELALLAYLAIEHGQNHNRQAVIGLLWPERDQLKARNNLRVALARLRKAVDQSEPPLIQTNRHTLRFDSQQLAADGSAWLDIAEFGTLLAAVESHAHSDPTQCKSCLADMARAADLYQGELLHGFHLDECEAFEHWLLVQRERFHMQITALLPKLERAHCANQEWKAAEKIVRQRLSLDPLDEDGHRTLMQVLALNGLRNAALAHYDTCLRILEDELGVPPSDETVALAEAIRNGDLLSLRDDTDVGGSIGASLRTPDSLNLQSKIVSTFDPYAILGRLEPLPEQRLFGVDKALNTVRNAIEAQARSWLISIEGIGGLGKTSLANELVKSIIKVQVEAKAKDEDESGQNFDDIAWVSAKQEEYVPSLGIQSTRKPALTVESLMDQLLAQLADGPYPTGSTQEKRLALTQLLQEKTCLVIVDNLETAVDSDALLPLLRHLANPSKFLLTSRMSLAGQSDVFAFNLGEMNEDDALAFLSHEAQSRGMRALSEASDEQLLSIYATVGGNPLALKLVLGQLQFLPLEQILQGLREAEGQRIEELYTYIYWQIWQSLDATSRHLLLCMPIVPNASFTHLAQVSGLEANKLQQSIMKLRDASLVEIGGDLSETRYRIHRLTETFLMNEVIKWQRQNEYSDSEETQYFVQRVLHMVTQWHEAEAVQAVDVARLDQEFELVTKAISLGLELEEGWDVVRPLVVAFTPFMERRGHWRAWHSILVRAIDKAHAANDIDGEITLTALLARLCQRESRPEDVVYYYRRVIRMARRNGNRFEEARACSNLGYAYIDGNRWWRAEILCTHALHVFKELDSEHGRAHTHNHLGVLFTKQCKWGAAEHNLSKACAIWGEISDSHGRIRGEINLGQLYATMENPVSALQHLTVAEQLSEEIGESSELAGIWNNIAYVHRLNLDWGNALKYAEQAEELFRKTSNYLGLAHVWNNLGLVAYGSERTSDALNYLQRSRETYRELGNLDGIQTVESEMKKIIG